jgi:hypothetical protein
VTIYSSLALKRNHTNQRRGSMSDSSPTHYGFPRVDTGYGRSPEDRQWVITAHMQIEIHPNKKVGTRYRSLKAISVPAGRRTFRGFPTKTHLYR